MCAASRLYQVPFSHRVGVIPRFETMPSYRIEWAKERDDEWHPQSCRAQLAFPSNPFVPLVQMLDLIFGLAILTRRKKSNNLVPAERVPTHGWPIIHTLSDAEFAS